MFEAPTPQVERQIQQMSEDEEVRGWLRYTTSRFGLSEEVFEGLVATRANVKLLSLVPADHAPPTRPAPLSCGLPFLHITMRYPKPTTGAAQWFGARATRSVVELTAEQADAFVQRAKHIELDEAQLISCDAPGHAIARFEGVALGAGTLRFDEARTAFSIESMFPKSLALASGRTAFDAR